MRNKKTILRILTIILIVVSFIGGAATQALTGGIINVVNLSEVETLEQEISEESFLEDFLSVMDVSYEEASYLNEIAPSLYYEIEKYYIEKDTDYNYTNTFLGFKNDLEKNHLKVIDDVLYGIIVSIDTEYYLNTYRDKLNQDTIKYLEFRIYEEKNHLYNPNVDSIDLEETVKRIDKINERINEGTYHIRSYEFLKDYYLKIFSGESHDYFVDFDEEKLRPYAEKMYEKYSNREDKIGEISRDILNNGPWQQEYFSK
jgi:hypothetical protein